MNKRGRISKEYLSIVKENINLGYAAVADILKRPESAVRQFCERHGIRPNSNTDEDDKRRKMVKGDLQAESFWPVLVKQLSVAELEYFIQQYAAHIIQFERTAKVAHTEKMQLMHLIRNDILLDRCMARQKEHLDEMEKIKQKIDKETKSGDADPKELKNLNELYNAYSSAFATFAKEASELQSKLELMRKNLNITREQRTKNIQEANSSFGAYIESLEDELIREREGAKINIFRAAMEKERARLMEYHTYVDGEVDIPLLNADTIMILDSKNKNEDKLSNEK
jgi:DNA-binding protein H-NS